MSSWSVPPGPLARLALGPVQILVPQQEVHTLEPLSELVMEDVPPPACAAFRSAGVHWPVYALDEDLQPGETVPPGRRICAMLRHRGGLYGVLVDQVATVLPDALRMNDLPACLAPPQGLFEALAVHGEEVLCLTSAERIARAAGLPDPASTTPASATA